MEVERQQITTNAMAMAIQQLVCIYVFSWSVLTLSQTSAIVERQLVVAVAKTTSMHRKVNTKSAAVPTDTCTASPIGTVAGDQTLLKLVHAHGPCSPTKKPMAPTEILSRELIISSKLVGLTDATNLPAFYDSEIGSGDFVVAVGVGTPSRQFYLPIETGLSLTWIQCQPCRQCYSQKEPIFDPTKSSSYSSIACGSSSCIKDEIVNCSRSDSRCAYTVELGDSSTSGGLSNDLLSLNDLNQRFVFGCSDNNVGSFGTNAGVLGLGSGPLSIIKQKESLFKNFFSYCIPPSPSSPGFLKLGSDGDLARFSFVPYSPSLPAEFYSFDLTSFTIGNASLTLTPPLPMLISTSFIFTRLPRVIYTSLKDQFMKSMAGFPGAPSSLLDPCYDLSNASASDLPFIDFIISDQLGVSLSINNFFFLSSKQACFAYLPTDNDFGIFAANQQQSFDIGFDLQGQRVGIGGNC